MNKLALNLTSNSKIRRTLYLINFIINLVVIISRKKIWGRIFYLITNQGSGLLIRALLMGRIDNEMIIFLIYIVNNNNKINYSSDYQDYFVLFYFHSNSINYKTIFFIDIGAHDGVTKSNTLLIESVGIDGLCLEANHKLSNLILKNRKCIVESSAIVTTKMKTNTYMLELKGDKHLMSSLKKTHKNAKNSITTISVADFIFKYKNILRKYSEFYISIDIEGNDFIILEDFLELGFKPRIISIEHNHNAESMKNILKLAQKYGYKNNFKGFFRNEFVLTK